MSDLRGLIVLATVLILFTNFYIDSLTSTTFMAALLFALITFHPEVKALAFAGFLAGALSDLALNVITHKFPETIRGKYMIQYFEEQGTWLAAAFAGMLTSWMVLGTYAISGNNLNAVAGFVVGAGWGVASQYALALKPLLPFYENTEFGYVENRIWDGMSVVFAIVWIQAAKIKVNEMN